MKKTLLIAGVLAVSGLSAGAAQAADEAAAKASCTAAEEARKMAAELKFEWNTTQPLIAKGMEAASKGEYAHAVKLCDTAKMQGEAAVAQAKQQAEAYKAAVIK
jgi:multidrug resistance efflux pump